MDDCTAPLLICQCREVYFIYFVTELLSLVSTAVEGARTLNFTVRGQSVSSGCHGAALFIYMTSACQ